jgi:hypothetical protein
LLVGILIGIGETRADRLVALSQLLQLHRQYGHIQEVIIQNFRQAVDNSTTACVQQHNVLEDAVHLLSQVVGVEMPCSFLSKWSVMSSLYKLCGTV